MILNKRLFLCLGLQGTNHTDNKRLTMKQEFLGYLTKDELECKNCKRVWIGTEDVEIISDRNIWVKSVECPKCKTILVLDAIKYEELPL